MNIYLVIQPEKYTGYDTFDSFIVVANTEDEARYTHPTGSEQYDHEKKLWYHQNETGDTKRYYDMEKYSWWTNKTNELTVLLIGKAHKRYTNINVLCSSFHAG